MALGKHFFLLHLLLLIITLLPPSLTLSLSSTSTSSFSFLLPRLSLLLPLPLSSTTEGLSKEYSHTRPAPPPAPTAPQTRDLAQTHSAVRVRSPSLLNPLLLIAQRNLRYRNPLRYRHLSTRDANVGLKVSFLRRFLCNTLGIIIICQSVPPSEVLIHYNACLNHLILSTSAGAFITSTASCSWLLVTMAMLGIILQKLS